MGWNGSETDGLRRPHRTETANCVAGERHEPHETGNVDCAAGERHEPQRTENPDCTAGERYTPYGAGNQDCAATGTPRERCGPHGAGPVPKAVFCRRRWARAAAALVVLGTLGLLLGRVFAPSGGPVAAGPVPAPPTGPVPSAGATDGPSAPRAVPSSALSTQGPAPAKRLWRGVEVVSSAGAETNRDGAVVERLVLADGRRVRAVSLPTPAFRHPSDQLLAMALSARPGEALPPLPLGPDVERDFLRSLEDPIEELPTDSADVRELKRRVAEARETLAEEVRAGRRVRDVLEEYQRGQEHTASVRLMAVREVEAVREAEGAEAARRFAMRANGTLRAGGVPEIPVPGGHGPADGDGGDEHGKKTEGD